MYIQFPLHAPIMMSEMSSIKELIDKSFINNSECEIKWGVSPREDNISRIVLSFKQDSNMEVNILPEDLGHQ